MDCKICNIDTGSDRPYCSMHINNSPYIRLLEQYNQNRTREAKISDRILNLNGLLATEILEFLVAQPRTKSDICLQVDINITTANRYIPALREAGYIIQDWAVVESDGARQFMYRITPDGLHNYRELTNQT
jgi:predicted transcriptional regulator